MGGAVTVATTLPPGPTIREIARQALVESLSFTTSVVIFTVAAPGRTSARTKVPHCATCTGLVLVSHTCR